MINEASLSTQIAKLFAPHHPPRDNFENALYRQQQTLIVEVGGLMGFVTIATTLLISAVFLPTTEAWKVGVWAAPLLLYAAFMIISFNSLKSKEQPKHVSGSLLKYSEVGALLMGAQYGLSLVLFPGGSMIAELFIIATIAGMGAGVASIVSTLPRMCVRFLIGNSSFLIINAIAQAVSAEGKFGSLDFYYITAFECMVIILYVALIIGSMKNYSRLVRLVSTSQESREARETLFNAIEATTDAFALISADHDIKIANKNHLAWFPNGNMDLTRHADAYALENGRRVKRDSHDMDNGDKVVVHTDITDLYNKQLELERARREAEEADHAKSRFLSGMSHELRTPLHIIIGYSSLMEEDSNITFTPEEMKENSTRIHRAGRDLLKFVEDMLEYSQIEQQFTQGSFELVPLKNVVEQQIAKRLKADTSLKRAHISFGAEKAASDVMVNSELANRVISELLDNAVKFRGQADPRVIVRLGTAGGRTVVSVTDFGCGIDEDAIKSAFIPFSSKKTNGVPDSSGIGLSLCRHVARLAGGDVRLISEVDKGTTAYWMLGPRSFQQADRSEQSTDKLAS